jgi:hypothetical protein
LSNIELIPGTKSRPGLHTSRRLKGSDIVLLGGVINSSNIDQRRLREESVLIKDICDPRLDKYILVAGMVLKLSGNESYARRYRIKQQAGGLIITGNFDPFSKDEYGLTACRTDVPDENQITQDTIYSWY